MDCREVEDKLAAFADGEDLSAHAPIVAHLQTCGACRASLHAQSVARTVLRARAAELSSVAPPGLRTRVVANLGQHLKAPETLPDISWGGRLTAFATAAIVVLTLGAVLLPVATIRSTALLAAQLALDHLKCFTIEGDADGTPISKAEAEATLRREYDLVVDVPPSLPDERLDLMAVRRCLYGDGRAARVMYRLDGEPVSLFVIPDLSRPPAELSLFGHDQVVWTAGDRTDMLVARAGLRERLSRVAPYLRTEAK